MFLRGLLEIWSKMTKKCSELFKLIDNIDFYPFFFCLNYDVIKGWHEDLKEVHDAIWH